MKRLLAFLLLFASSTFAQVVGPGDPNNPFASGISVPGCTISSIVYIDASGNLACARTPINGSVSTAGRSILTIRDTITGGTGNNFLDVLGRFPAAPSGTTTGARFLFTTSASDVSNVVRTGLRAELNPETSASGQTTAQQNALQGASTAEGGSTASMFSGVNGIQGSSLPATSTGTPLSIGVIGGAKNGSTAAFGVAGLATISSTSPFHIGVFGEANTASGQTSAAGGYFALDTVAGLGVLPTAGSIAAIVGDNGPSTGAIASLRDNGALTSTTGATANVTVLDGAQMRLGNMGLTSSTMTPTIVSEARTVTHSYAWTNAMVVALGGVTAGDINVATLPAKTQVQRALIVIDTAAAGVTTLTVSCGDATVGTPFTNYVLAGDAKAAANTVYGDAISGAETGASLFDATAKWIPAFLPSYTATTLVTCHFISTGGNLNTVTTSTGRLILTTTLLP